MNDQEILEWLKENKPVSCEQAFDVLRHSKITQRGLRGIWKTYRNWNAVQPYENWVAKQKDFLGGRDARVLNIDGEIAPSVTLSFDFFKTSPFRILTPRKIISLSCSFNGEKKIWGKTIADYPEYTLPPFIEGLDKKLYLAIAIGLIDKAEKALLKDFFEIYEKADVVVGHNLKKFDVKFLHVRALYHGLETVPVKRQEDTLEMCKRYFKLERNTLDYACEYFGIPTKTEERYADLIDDCLLGDTSTWKKLSKYNNQDVYIDDLLYDKIKAYHRTHYNLNLITRKDACPVCQSENTIKTDYKYYRTSVKQNYKCGACGHPWTGEPISRSAKQEAPLLETEAVNQSNI